MYIVHKQTRFQVSIEMRVGEGRTAEIVMMQSEVRAKLGDFKVTFDKGSYPQPRTSVIQGIEIFKVKYQTTLKHDVYIEFIKSNLRGYPNNCNIWKFQGGTPIL